MPAVMPSKLLQMSRASNPKDAIMKAIGPALNDIDVFGAQLLVGTYIASERTSGGIILPNQTLAEDIWQGSVGLVLKKGPWAFEDDPEVNIYWKGQNVQIGQWVMFRFSAAWEQHLNGVSVRFVDDRDIKAVISTPLLLKSKPSVVVE